MPYITPDDRILFDRSQNIAGVTGVLENVKQELYRRSFAPYEDLQALSNGDLSDFTP